jgi:deferrochelatase/peroxidase EfeB
VLELAGLTAAGVAVGGLATLGIEAAVRADGAADQAALPDLSGTEPFHGEHQAGIATVAQERLVTVAFDVTSDRRQDIQALLQAWTAAAEKLTAGQPVGPVAGIAEAPPGDTGEATGLGAAHLTVTVGFGPTVFEADGVDRFGFAARRPAPLVDIPPFRGDELDATRTGGDILVQACADDAQVAYHAVRNLARIGRGIVTVRWAQLGFGRTSTTSIHQTTPRNLMGFRDGTNNLRSEDSAGMAQHVWVGAGDDPGWMVGGTYAVVRRIRMLIEIWDRSSLGDQEGTIGRLKVTGAPIGRAAEEDTVPLDDRAADGSLLVPKDAHVRLAAPADNGGVKILRRGYSFTDGLDPRTGELDAGLFFVCFQRDPRSQFIPIQQRLAGSDALNEYIRHTGSGIFAIPPGIQPGGMLGSGLFD